MQSEAAPTLSIPLSKGKIALLTLAAFVFVIGGLAMCAVGWVAPINFGFGIGAVSVLFFGPIGVFLLRKLFDSRPALVIDAEGIVDNTSGISAGRILWSEVVAVTASEVVGQRFVNVHVVDPQRYLAQGNAIQRFLRR